MAYNYRHINYEVMSNTEHCYKTIPELKSAIKNSIERQFMVSEEDDVEHAISNTSTTKYIVSGKRSFEAAKDYKGKKVAVLNHANNHSIGGSPYSAGAQEESLCRCSTLYPCLQAMKEPFYMKHRNQYSTHEIDYMGNNDLIYTPDVVVFKTDERTEPVYPRMLEHDDWYKVNVISCAAPQMQGVVRRPDNYEDVIRSRIKKILDVAAKEGNEVIIQFLVEDHHIKALFLQ